MLNQWLLSLFGVKRFEDLAEHLRNERLEGLDENNVHYFCHALTAQLFNLTYLSTELLLEYDQNIVKHTQRLNDRRITVGEDPIIWKYFQYLTLLFTEIYLDRYFSDATALLKLLNVQVAATNADRPEADQIAAFDENAEAWPQLNKLAYWSATGSGKTLLMHANILQYQFYLHKHERRRELNHTAGSCGRTATRSVHSRLSSKPSSTATYNSGNLAIPRIQNLERPAPRKE